MQNVKSSESVLSTLLSIDNLLYLCQPSTRKWTPESVETIYFPAHASQFSLKKLFGRHLIGSCRC